MQMHELFEALDAELLIESVDLVAFVREADAALLAEVFDDEDVDRLDALGDLLLACGAGALAEDQALAMEGALSFLKKAKAKVAKKLPPGTKMVFGKIVKVGQAAGRGAAAAAKGTATAAKATARGAQKTAGFLVRAKRAIQAAGYGFTRAGREAKAAAKKVAAAKGRAAGEAAYQAAKGTYAQAVKAGEGHGYAAGQAQRAAAKAGGRAKAAQYGGNAPARAKPKPKPKAKRPAKPVANVVPIARGKKRRAQPLAAGMDIVFDMVEQANLSSLPTEA